LPHADLFERVDQGCSHCLTFAPPVVRRHPPDGGRLKPNLRPFTVPDKPEPNHGIAASPTGQWSASRVLTATQLPARVSRRRGAIISGSDPSRQGEPVRPGTGEARRCTDLADPHLAKTARSDTAPFLGIAGLQYGGAVNFCGITTNHAASSNGYVRETQ
jgi:hypothetical protein